MQLTIKKVEAKPFKGENGDSIPYFWTRATKVKDDVSLQFGSKFDWSDEIGHTVEVELEQRQGGDGKVRWFEVQ